MSVPLHSRCPWSGTGHPPHGDLSRSLPLPEPGTDDSDAGGNGEVSSLDDRKVWEDLKARAER